MATLNCTKNCISLMHHSRFKLFRCFSQSNTTLSSPARKRIKWKYFILGGLVLGPGLYYQTLDTYDKREVKITVSGIGRFLRSLRIGIAISFDYWWHLRGLKEDSMEYLLAIKPCHTRSANRILQGCLLNGGLYIKFGQGLVSLNHILPREYVDTLSILHDKALSRRDKELEELFIEDFGCLPEEVFSEFNREAVARASLAQVFKAKTQEGDDVAVKVQYIDLQQRFNGDCNTIFILLKLIGKMHPNFNFTWVMNYLKETLVFELDFINEGLNMERCSRELAHMPYVYVPKVHWDKCTTRVLTAEYIDGANVSESEKIVNLGLKLADVDQKLILMFSEQIFHTGFVHADPHPGNVFVRKGDDGMAQIVLLDHGLYELLPEQNRLSLCKLWKAIVLNDRSNMKKYCDELGVEDYYLFCEILMQRPLGRSGVVIPTHMTDSDVAYMKKMAQQHFDQIMATIQSLPLPMLLVFRNINTVRSIVKQHGNPVNRYILMARRATRGGFVKTQFGPLSYIAGWLSLIHFDLVLRCEYLKKMAFGMYLHILVFFGRISRNAASELIGLMS